MGRRSINTTKSGKYMNPTDQARKEARKQELKKNKKQRQMVRAAVLKGKDPYQILEELEKIDQMEFNVNQPSPLNEKVLKEKRKKLRETLDRVLSMYYKDDHDKWADLKRKQSDYEHKRNQMVAFFESVKSAQQVQVDEIPLPQLPQQAQSQNTPAQIPLPAERKQEHTIYSIATALKLQALGKHVREPPGCPPGPPPDFNEEGEVISFGLNMRDEEEEETDEVRNQDSNEPSPQKPTSLQQKMVALSGQNVDEFMKEMETVQKKTEIGKETENRPKISHIEPLIPPGTDPPILSNPPGLPIMFPNPGLRLPPGPPPGRPLLPPGPPPGLPPPRMTLRLPTSAPRIIRVSGPSSALGSSTGLSVQATPNVLTAGPQLIGKDQPMTSKQGATISAKPQIRNLSADVTRFVPSALRVKREDKTKKPNAKILVQELKQKEMNLHQQTARTQVMNLI